MASIFTSFSSPVPRRSCRHLCCVRRPGGKSPRHVSSLATCSGRGPPMQSETRFSSLSRRWQRSCRQPSASLRKGRRRPRRGVLPVRLPSLFDLLTRPVRGRSSRGTQSRTTRSILVFQTGPVLTGGARPQTAGGTAGDRCPAPTWGPDFSGSSPHIAANRTRRERVVRAREVMERHLLVCGRVKQAGIERCPRVLLPW